MNTNMQTLISMQQTTEATSALQLVGSTVTVSGNDATFPTRQARRRVEPHHDDAGDRQMTVTSSVGTTVYTGSLALNAGTQSFKWSGQGNNGQTWPDGTYTLAVTATGANGQAVNVSSQVQGIVSGVNLSAQVRRRSRWPDKAFRSARSRRSPTNRPLCRGCAFHPSSRCNGSDRRRARAAKAHQSSFVLRQILSRRAYGQILLCRV